MSCSLPSRSVLNEYLADNDDGSQIEEKDVHSDSCEYHSQGEDEDVDDLRQITSLAEAWKPKEKGKKPLKHLWHAALVLLLERGRSVTRRVVVTSSPLYQPMDGMEQLGYELRVYVRVPDLGTGMDRDRRRDSTSSFSGGKNAQSGPSNAVSLQSAKNKMEMLGHVRRVSGNTSAESGGGSGNASGGKIKYREQGVDELLQLKLHQALAATDDVPEGSTIVLATGDGNMGEFNEEGFLGPVRTALRRGWKVELYAWEDGLSRAWRREFGEGTEWGRKGMFRVIGMEQFAGSLVEVIDQ
ncbi:hypothetical protein BYT27DRAFT_7089968 [Phlegmacium glaucopus]|nr:hypothetical protein BYT27DRAFT_7089968 [Phlegmacium glaucopus]